MVSEVSWLSVTLTGLSLHLHAMSLARAVNKVDIEVPEAAIMPTIAKQPNNKTNDQTNKAQK